MADTEARLDEIGYWSEVKLDIVRKYAAAYSTILSSKSFCKGHLYIDAFAGAGTHLSKTTGEFVQGSPLNALQVQPPFSELHFIDLDGERTKRLKELTRDDARVTVHAGDCNDVLLREVFPRCRYEDFKRGLCLLDPYGLTVKWDVLQQAGQMGTLDVFYNFMIMDANMNVFWRDPSRVDPTQVARMNAVWGDESWRQAAYRQEQDLFGEVTVKGENDDIAEAFRQRLKDVAGFAHVPPPIPMRNSRGAVVYYLYFAAKQPVAGKIVTEIFDTYRKRGMA